MKDILDIVNQEMIDDFLENDAIEWLSKEDNIKIAKKLLEIDEIKWDDELSDYKKSYTETDIQYEITEIFKKNWLNRADYTI